MANVLVVDDEKDIGELVKDILEDEGHTVRVATGGEAAKTLVNEWVPDFALLDIWMPDIDGITLLKQWVEANQLTFPAVVMSGHGTIDTAIEATRLGAFDYIEKPLSMNKLLQTTERALALGAEQNSADASPAVAALTGSSERIKQLREELKNVAQIVDPVVLVGEAGVGKTICARFIHQSSKRSAQPLAILSSSNDQLVADLNVTRAQTVVIKNLHQMSPQTQRDVVEWIELHRNKPNNPKIILTSSTPLDMLLSTGKMSQALFTQLRAFEIGIPTLAEHVEDIPDLVKAFVDHYAEHEGLNYKKLSVAALNHLRNQSWPGNITELKLTIKRLLLDEASDTIELENVSAMSSSLKSAQKPQAENLGIDLSMSLRDAREQFERLYIEHQLEKCDGNVAQAAKRAGMERTHLYRKIRQLGLDNKDR